MEALDEDKKTDTVKSFRIRNRRSIFDPAKQLIQDHTRGPGIKNINEVKDKVHRAKLFRNERKIRLAEKQAAQTEILLTENAGFLIPDEGEVSKRITQKQIRENVDITSATKCFELDLDFGPYSIDYTRNGRHLVIGGKKGHVAAFDWVTKKLHCEINVMEEVADVQWLHIETMFAVAQKNWVYIYDNQGVELHCLKQLYRVLKMTFLPYHFLLATSNEDGWLNWLDVSIGKNVAAYHTKEGRLSVMTQNPYNACLCLGHSKGVVTMWSPNENKPLVSMLCHNTGVQTISIDPAGKYMVTGSTNKQLKVWDIRSLGNPLFEYKLKATPFDSSISQRGCLALATYGLVQIFQNINIESPSEPYLVHNVGRTISNIEFCPYEDILGIGSRLGFTSILVPGAGEPNYDGMEANPMQSKSQRKEAEVKSLLDKIQPEMICLDPSTVFEVNVPSLKERYDAKVKILNLKPQNINFVPRKKKRGNTARASRVKKIVKENHRKEFIKNLKAAKEIILNENTLEEDTQPKSKPGVLDRFKSKKTT